HTRCLSDWSSDVCSSDLWIARKIVQRLRRRFGVRVQASLLTGRILVEYDETRVDLHDVLARVAEVELPDLPGEDRPAHPLDPGRSEERRVGKECRARGGA